MRTEESISTHIYVKCYKYAWVAGIVCVIGILENMLFYFLVMRIGSSSSAEKTLMLATHTRKETSVAIVTVQKTQTFPNVYRGQTLHTSANIKIWKWLKNASFRRQETCHQPRMFSSHTWSLGLSLPIWAIIWFCDSMYYLRTNSAVTRSAFCTAPSSNTCVVIRCPWISPGGVRFSQSIQGADQSEAM